MSLKRDIHEPLGRKIMSTWAYWPAGIAVVGMAISACVGYPSGYSPDVGVLRIYPVPALDSLPSLEYRFYSEDTCLVRPDDGWGNFEGELPAGLYRVLAVNRDDADAANVTFTGMDRYETATVTVRNAQPGDPGETDAQPDEYNSPNKQTRSRLLAVNCQLLTVKEEVKVTGNGDTRKEPVPVLLTKQLVFDFTLSGGLETQVASIAGVLPGFYASVGLSTGLPVPASVSQSPETTVGFEVFGQGGERSAQIGLLGLHDPKEEPVYTCKLALTLTMNDGSPDERFSFDLTDRLSAIIAGNRGVFPSTARIILELVRTPVGGITGRIEYWGSGGQQIVTVN